MTNPFVKNDTYFKNGETFQRKITGKEFGSSVSNFFKLSWAKVNFLYIFIVVLLIYVFSAINYFNWGLFTNIFSSSVMVGVVAIGMGLIMLLGDIDLSVGSSYVLSAIIGVMCYNYVIEGTGNTLIGFFVFLVVTIVCGALLGLVNGFFIGILKMPSFIVTLATMLIYRSLGQYIQNIFYTAKPTWTNGSIITVLNPSTSIENGNWVRVLGSTQVLQITIPTMIFILIGVVVWLITKYSKFGRKIYAVGSNAKAASLVGIKTNYMKMVIYTIAGALVGFAAFLHIATNGSIDAATGGSSYELYAIASVVLGGIAMSGGKGSIIGVIFGTAAFQTIDKIIAALNLNAFLNDAIKGAILIIAILLQVIRFNKQFFIPYLQKLNLVYTPNKDLLLEAEYKTKVENLEKVYDKKIDVLNHKTNLDDEQFAALVYKLLDEKEAKLLALKNKYDVLIEKARVLAQVHDHDEKLKEEIKVKKHEIENQKQYDIYLLKNKKSEVKPMLGEYYKYEKDIVLKQTKFASANNIAILKLKSEMGLSTNQIESLRKFNLGYADDQEAIKVNEVHDKLLAKYESHKSRLNAKIDDAESKLVTDLSNLETKFDAAIEKHVANDKANYELYKSKKEKLQTLIEQKEAKKEEHKKHKAEIKAQKEALKAKQDEEKQEVEKRLAKRLKNILANRNK